MLQDSFSLCSRAQAKFGLIWNRVEGWIFGTPWEHSGWCLARNGVERRTRMGDKQAQLHPTATEFVCIQVWLRQSLFPNTGAVRCLMAFSGPVFMGDMSMFIWRFLLMFSNTQVWWTEHKCLITLRCKYRKITRQRFLARAAHDDEWGVGRSDSWVSITDTVIDEYWNVLYASYPSPNSKCLSCCQQGLKSKTQPPRNKGVKTPRKPTGAGFVLLMVGTRRHYCLLCVIMTFCCGLVWFNLFPMV